MDNENETNHNMIQKILYLKNVLEQKKKIYHRLMENNLYVLFNNLKNKN